MKESYCFQGDKCILFLNGKRENLWRGCWDSALFRGTWEKNEICPLLQEDKIDIFMKRYFIFKATGLKCIDKSMGSKTFKGKR